MKRWLSPRTAVIVHDLLMIALAWELAWLARFNFSLPTDNYWQANLKTLPLVLLVQGLIAWRFGLYRGLWRFASLPDLWNIFRAALLGALSVTLVLFVAIRLEDVPRSVLILYPMFLIFLLGGPRLAYRLYKDHSLNLHATSPGKRVLILGAGRAGEAVARDMLRDDSYLPAGFLDDSPRLLKARIQGVPVLGRIADLAGVVADYDIDMLFIAIPSAGNAEMQRIVGLCAGTGKPVRTLPPLSAMLGNEAQPLSELKEVSIDDLLGRDKVELDWGLIRDGLAGRRVLVTGGGGSIGSELCRQVARMGPRSLLIFEQSEFNLYEIERSLRAEFPALDIQARLGDVLDRQAVARAFTDFAPHIVFHAAAYKHVPILQSQAREAARNNIVGTRILAEAADRAACEKFVMVSTDKAVNPSSVMGASKRVAEMFCEALNRRSGTRFVTVRFGNVLGSAGSVVPLFQEQIRNGGPVTVTHREMRRYFMTIPEASQLILQAGAMGQGGEIYVLDMGEPVRIAFLAEQMIRLSGKQPGVDIPIEYTGVRPGEKLHEELFHQSEDLVATGHAKILQARHRGEDWERLNEMLERLERACYEYAESSVLEILRTLVPEMQAPPADGATNIIPLTRSSA